MVSSFRDSPIALELLELYWNGFDHIFLIVHSLCRLMVRALLLMFLSLVYRRDPFLAPFYIQCPHPLLARFLDAIKSSSHRAPIYIQELLQLYTPSRNLRSSNRNLLVKPYFNLHSYGKRAFSVAAPKLWNNLPEDIKSANSIDDFKRILKTFLFMRAYES